MGKIDKVPGQGVVRTNFFIPGKEVYSPAGELPGYNTNMGDNRGFDPSLAPENSRVAVVVDHENGLIVTRQNPSVNATTGTLGIEPTADGPKIGGNVTTFPALEIYGQRPGMDTQTLLQSWPSFADNEWVRSTAWPSTRTSATTPSSRASTSSFRKWLRRRHDPLFARRPHSPRFTTRRHN